MLPRTRAAPEDPGPSASPANSQKCSIPTTHPPGCAHFKTALLRKPNSSWPHHLALSFWLFPAPPCPVCLQPPCLVLGSYVCSPVPAGNPSEQKRKLKGTAPAAPTLPGTRCKYVLSTRSISQKQKSSRPGYLLVLPRPFLPALRVSQSVSKRSEGSIASAFPQV